MALHLQFVSQLNSVPSIRIDDGSYTSETCLKD